MVQKHTPSHTPWFKKLAPWCMLCYSFLTLERGIIMADFDEFEGGFSIQDMMDDTEMTREGVRSWLFRNGYKPFRKEGSKGFYKPHVLHELMTRKKYKASPKSKTSHPSKISQEYEERITYLEDKCKEFERQILEIQDLFEIEKSP